MLLPFLISVQAENGESADIVNRSFNAAENVIILEVSARAKNQELIFLFPSCSGKYYKVHGFVN